MLMPPACPCPGLRVAGRQGPLVPAVLLQEESQVRLGRTGVQPAEGLHLPAGAGPAAAQGSPPGQFPLLQDLQRLRDPLQVSFPPYRTCRVSGIPSRSVPPLKGPAAAQESGIPSRSVLLLQDLQRFRDHRSTPFPVSSDSTEYG